MSSSGGTSETPKKQSEVINPPVHNSVDDTFFVGSTSKPQRRIPQWLDHFNVKDLKILFKTSLAVWITTLFIFIKPTLDVIGPATFFAG